MAKIQRPGCIVVSNNNVNSTCSVTDSVELDICEPSAGAEGRVQVAEDIECDQYCVSSNDESEGSDSVEETEGLECKLASWVSKHFVTQTATNDLFRCYEAYDESFGSR